MLSDFKAVAVVLEGLVVEAVAGVNADVFAVDANSILLPECFRFFWEYSSIFVDSPDVNCFWLGSENDLNYYSDQGLIS